MGKAATTAAMATAEVKKCFILKVLSISIRMLDDLNRIRESGRATSKSSNL